MRVREIPAKPQPVWGGHSCPPTADSKLTQAGNFGRRFVLAISTSLLALAPYAAAQRAAHAITSRSTTPHLNSPAGSFAFGRAAYSPRFHQPFPYTSLPFPFFADSFNPDDIYSTGYPVAAQLPVIMLQAARTMSHRDYAESEPATAQPLMIELQNGRYVRVNNTAADGEALPLNLAPDAAQSNQPQRAKSARSNSIGPAIAAASLPHDLPPAVLVFRDGHSEEVRDYTIADGILYARGDYYTDGYWNKKIALAALNIPETLQANATRNVKFVLPASPNEVITRP